MRKGKTILLLVAVVLVCSTLLTFTLTSKKVVSFKKTEKILNPDNLLMNENLHFCENLSEQGIFVKRNEDGSCAVVGKSDKAILTCLTYNPLNYLENGKTYTLSSPGSKAIGYKTFTIAVRDVTANIVYCVSDFLPDPSTIYRGSTFVYDSTHEYWLMLWVSHPGCVIDDVLYPCLVEGDQPGDFYIEKTP